MKVVVTGGAGFVGSHVAEYYAGRGAEVTVIDNLGRAEIFGSKVKNTDFNWNYLKGIGRVELVKKDVRDFNAIKDYFKDAEIVVHAAAQTAVTTSVIDPATDFTTNAMGTFNVLEAARLANTNPKIVYCSTNKVYGENVNKIKVEEEEKRYKFEEKFNKGIPESFSTDLCGHSPYGCSKLTGDIYMQDYFHQYGLRTGVFRMSCIYGTRQFGIEDQGWVAWFVIAALTGQEITIYGDGKQVRDVLFVSDLVRAYDLFVESGLKHGIFNIGGGVENTLSLLELLDLIKEETGSIVKPKFSGWRPADQKVYISNIRKINEELNWQPETDVKTGVKKLINWVNENKKLFGG